MSEMRGAIIEALNILDRDDFVLGLLLLMRDEGFANAVEQFANTHPDHRTIILNAIRNTRSDQGKAANENADTSDR